MRRLAALSAVALLFTACGDSGDDDPPREAATPAFRHDCPEPPNDAKLRLEVDTLAPPQTQGQVTWRLVVTNEGSKRVTLVFPSALHGDVTLEQGGDETYRWSRAREFTQAIECFDLEPGDSARIDLENDQLEINPGDYNLTASLPSRPAPPEVKRTFTVAGH